MNQNNEHQKFITDEIDKLSDTPKVKWLSMYSKFAGTCVKCNGSIDQGESILWNKEKGAKHETCHVISNDIDDYSITVIDNDNLTPKVWIDPKRYSYSILQIMNECQCCGVDVSNKSKRYIDDDRLVCVNHFG